MTHGGPRTPVHARPQARPTLAVALATLALVGPATLGTLAVVPTAGAQVPDPGLPLDPPPDVSLTVPADPDNGSRGSVAEATLNVTATCPTPAHYTEPYVAQVTATGQEPWLEVSVQETDVSFTFEENECKVEPASRSQEVALLVAFGPEAPAFRNADIALEAVGTTDEAPLGSSTWTVEVPFFGTLLADVEDVYRETEPGRVDVRITLINRANADILVAMRTERALLLGDVALPGPVEVTDRLGEDAGNGTRTVTLGYQVREPGADGLLLELAAVATQDTTQALEPILVEIDIDTENQRVRGEQVGEADGVPLPPLIALAAALAAAQLRRRRGGP